MFVEKKEVDNSEEMIRAEEAKEEARMINERLRAMKTVERDGNGDEEASIERSDFSTPPHRRPPAQPHPKDGDDQKTKTSTKSRFAAISERQRQLVDQARERRASLGAAQPASRHEYEYAEDEADSFLRRSNEICTVTLSKGEYDAMLDRIDYLTMQNAELTRMNEKFQLRHSLAFA